MAGAEVGGMAVGGTAVGGAEVEVTTTGADGMGVLVGRIIMSLVGVGAAGAWVVMGGGAPVAGSLHAVRITASIASKMQGRRNFLFIHVSLIPNPKIPMWRFYIILHIV